jgi:hypothetical protein
VYCLRDDREASEEAHYRANIDATKDQTLDDELMTIKHDGGASEGSSTGFMRVASIYTQ